ncbi:MAG: DUF4340 domain-containing protein [Lachnospiraceae bacterium]|nr:DUF4340 domain-containing protein [Lachnospiraceae bacterium]
MTGKNKNKMLIVLVGVLIIVCAAYIGMTKYVKDSEAKKESEAAAQSEAGRIWVTEMAEVTGVAFGNGDSGEDGMLSFIKKDDIWYYEDDENFPVDQDLLASLATAAGSVEATRAIAESDDLADYGLDTPAAKVMVTDGGGQEVWLLIGNAVGSEYYLKTADNETVYTVGSDLMTAVEEKGLYDFVKITQLPSVSAEKILTMEVDLDGTSYKLERNETETDALAEDGTSADGETAAGDEVSAEEGTAAEGAVSTEDEESTEDAASSEDAEASEETETSEDTELTWRFYEKGKQQSGDHDNLGLKLAQSLSGMSISGCADYDAADSKLRSYGLDQSKMRMTYTFDDDGSKNSVTVYVGNMNEDGTEYYVLVNASSAVYTISAETIDGIRSYFENYAP